MCEFEIISYPLLCVLDRKVLNLIALLTCDRLRTFKEEKDLYELP